ncbi:M28 family peptidase [Tundrisphaera lichenicola]|uniref:M28 family metallopeptidase n=1 Tax=Tundrisphaera lichenicola TaxID=2029860 RepID=UPI003EB80B97
MRNDPGLAIWIVAALVSLCTFARADDLAGALGHLRGERVLEHIKVLASDDFEGRGPGTPGEDKTVAYLTDQFKAIGLKPGNPDGSFTQDVPLIGFQALATSGAIRFKEKTIDLKTSSDWVAVSRKYAHAMDELVRVGKAQAKAQPKGVADFRQVSAPLTSTLMMDDSEVVFVGYGVVAPEYGWDDYKGLDVKGKTVVMLINDPAVPDPADPSKLDPSLFQGKAMTYYGRWTYKYEIASEKGAAACLIVHETGPAGYPYEVVTGSWGRENFDLFTPDGNSKRVTVEGWLALDTARKIFEAAGQDFDKLKAAAARKDFQPVPLGAQADFSVKNQLRRVDSKNVVARLLGSDPKLQAEHVVYTAHWDHLGKDSSLDGDQIFNGAADNASGTAALLEIARGFTLLDTPPRRSILFLAVTAEEKGLLGARFYAEHPLYPLADTLADINMDVINLWGKTRDIVSVGLGNTTLDDLLAEAAKVQDRTIVGDPEPEKGMFYRSDHFEFAKQGVPALNAKAGIDYIGQPADYGRQKRDEYTKNDYHKVTDQVKPDWDLSGAVQDMQLLIDVGYRVAQGETYPTWKPGTEFKARREASLKAAGR